MSGAILSVLAVVATVALSMRKGIHAGIVALSLAWLIGRYGADLSVTQVVAFFPSDLFLILMGVTLFFGIAQANGTLNHLARLLSGLAGERSEFLPLIFFFFALALSTVGAGNIAAVALLAPVAIQTGHQTRIGSLLLTIMVISGANAGAFSPLAFTGVIANSLVDRAGLTMDPWKEIYLPSLAAQGGLAAVIYLLSWPKLRGRARNVSLEKREARFDGSQLFTAAAIIALTIGVLWLKADVGLLALTLASILGLFHAADQRSALEKLPWQAVMMVCGVSTLVGVAAHAGGLNIASGWIAKIGEGPLVTGAVAFLAAFVSIYSSSSGVVMPAFLSMVPDLAAKSGSDPVSLVASINVASHLVDVSPLSTLGAICVAAVPSSERDQVFRKLLYFGLGMSLVGGLVGYLFGHLWTPMRLHR